MTAPASPIVDQVVALTTAVQDLQTSAVTYTAGVVSSVNTAGLTFAANVPQPDGTTVNVAGIGVTSAQFMPTVGQTVSLALSGAQLIYQPVGITPGSIGLTQTSTDGPGVPTGLALTTAVVTNADGTTGAAITATWTAPTTSLSGGPVTETPTYVLSYKPSTVSGWHEAPATTTTARVLVTSGVAFDVRVASADRLGNRSAWSSIVSITTGVDTTGPGALSTPVVGNYLGQLKVTWDGLLSGGGALPSDFLTAQVHVSSTSGFTPAASTLVADMSTAGSVFVDAPYGATRYAKLVGKDLTGNLGPASAQGSGSTSQVVSADILAGAVGAAQLASLSVSTANLVDASVIQAKIAAGAVGSPQLVDTSVIQSKIGTGAVGSSQLASLAVQTANIADGAIVNAKIGALAVNTANIADASINSAKIANLAVTSADIADAAIITAKIADLAVNTAKIGNLAVGTAQMADLSVASAKIADAAIVTAKIGTLAVNDAQIGSLSVGKLTAGTLSSNITLSGRFATALTGARTEMNSLGFQKFDSSGNLIVSITSTDTLFHGEFKTATTGRRVEIGAGGTSGQVDFYSPTGQHCYVLAYTESNAAHYESIQMSMDVGGHYLWNTVNIDNIPQIAYHSNWHEFGMTTSGKFQIGQYTSSSSFTTGLVYRMVIDSGGTSLGRPNGNVFFDALESTPANKVRIMPSGRGVTGGGLDIMDNAATAAQSARADWVQQDAGGLVTKSYSNGFEIRNRADTVFTFATATAWNIASDGNSKTDIRDANLDTASMIKGLRVRDYVRKGDPGDPPGPREIGLVAQEAQTVAPQIVVSTPTSGGLAVSLYQYVTLLAAGIQQVIARIEALESNPKKGNP